MKASPVIIIAEAGVNHNGSISFAKKLIDEASRAGADYIKFQTFTASHLVTSAAEKAGYQKKNTGNASQLKMLQELELSENDHHELIEHARKRKIGFLSTPFDEESILLLKKLKLKTGKIPSGEITSLPYLRLMAQTFPAIILSTGMATLQEVTDAVKVLYKAGLRKERLTILHCTSEYPAPLSGVNLRAIKTLQQKFGVKVGYSDHTSGIEVAVAAVAMGAVLIEKHLTLDKKLKGPDHKASLEPAEFKNMVTMIRNVEAALGKEMKIPTAVELKNKIAARKSIVAATDIKKGELFSDLNLTIKRPGNGISPMMWDKVMGKKAASDFRMNDLIKL